MTKKEQYRQLCQSETGIPLSSRDWWLDAVAGKANWQVAIAEQNNQIIGSLPYSIKKNGPFRIVQMPRFTPSMGVWLKYPPKQKYHTRLAFEHKICAQLIEQLPRVNRFHQRFSPEFSNWLPFFWQDYRQTTRYVYVIPDISDQDALFKRFRDNVRWEIRKAQKQQLEVYSENNVADLFHLIRLTFERQGKKLGYSQKFLENLVSASVERNCGKLFFARDVEKQLHFGMFLAWDDNSAYYIIGGSNPAVRNSGATSLVLWEAIRFASGVTGQFNFTGSMIEPIEKFFRGFGGVQTPYFSIYKNDKLFAILDALRKRG
ncbi:MAG: GNAT family N-acetyltransferase [Calditrichia bacterium]